MQHKTRLDKSEQLNNRGYVARGIEVEFEGYSFAQKIELLNSSLATQRTIGARLLKSDKSASTVASLIQALKTEKKLYPKIELCNSLVELKELSVLPLIDCLGQIGSNQHKSVPEKEFLKDSYPLPRDIAARTLSSIGITALPYLLSNINRSERKVLSELLDAVGHINFYAEARIFQQVRLSYYRHITDDLLQWKIIRVCSGIKESKKFLIEQRTEISNQWLKKELDRSLRLINRQDK